MKIRVFFRSLPSISYFGKKTCFLLILRQKGPKNGPKISKHKAVPYWFCSKKGLFEHINYMQAKTFFFLEDKKWHDQNTIYQAKNEKTRHLRFLKISKKYQDQPLYGYFALDWDMKIGNGNQFDEHMLKKCIFLNKTAY